ncbi:MAG: hypothetical protein ACR2KL_13330 [Nocardioidaceae bacterium]
MNTTEAIRGWLTGRLPDEWFDGDPTVDIDRDEIVITGRLPAPAGKDDSSEDERSAAVAGRVRRFRESTRDERIAIARELEHMADRKVAWGVETDGDRTLFTSLAAPVMTRLRQPERRVLDTLVDAGVARSRSDALGWCVRLVAQHSDDWLAELRQAMEQVDEVRQRGPAA